MLDCCDCSCTVYPCASRWCKFASDAPHCVVHAACGVAVWVLQGDVLSPEEWAGVQELGILVDQDDQGVLMQVFTKPLGDR